MQNRAAASQTRAQKLTFPALSAEPQTAPSPQPALEALADLAPTLTESECRVLIELTRQALRNENQTTAASVRKLAERCKMSPQSVQTATAALEKRSLLTRRAGGSRSPSRIKVNFLDVVAIGVPTIGTPPPSGVPTASTVPMGPVPTIGTPPTENQQDPDPAARLDIRNDSIQNIDRVLNPRSKHHDEHTTNLARSWMFKLMTTYGPNRDAHPPDTKITREFLNIAPWPRLEALLRELMNARTPIGEQYAWFVTVAMQRIHGVQPAALRARRAELQLIKSAGKAKAAEITEAAKVEPDPTADPGFTAELLAQATAASKMR